MPYIDKHSKYWGRFDNAKPRENKIYYHGSINLLDKKIIGIVGSRKATVYGLSCTKILVQTLADLGFVICSGLAFGIDIMAHQTAIRSGGATIIVQPNSVERIYPKSHQLFVQNIPQKNKLILSEFNSPDSPQPFHFPLRNRFIAALSDVIVIPEADLQSGSLITASYASAFSKPIFAIPGNINQLLSAGPNLLIKNHKAQLLTDINDLLHYFKLHKESNQTPNLSPKEFEVYDWVRLGANSIEQIVLKSKLSTEEILQTASILEIKGILKNQNGYLEIC